MRKILDSDSNFGMILLPTIVGLLSAPNAAFFAQSFVEGYDGAIWIGAIVLSILSFWMYVYVYGGVYRWIAGWFGATGSNRDARLALAWTQVPFILIALAYVSVRFVYRDQLYPEVDISSVASMFSVLDEIGGVYWIGVVFLIPKIAAYIISLKLLGEACGFSAWKAFGVKLIAVLLHIPLFFVAGLLAIPFSIAWVVLTSG